jgi:hypothetical protein
LLYIHIPSLYIHFSLLYIHIPSLYIYSHFIAVYSHPIAVNSPFACTILLANRSDTPAAFFCRAIWAGDVHWGIRNN